MFQSIGHRHENVDVFSLRLLLSESEQVFCGRAERLDYPLFVNDDHGIGHGRQDGVKDVPLCVSNFLDFS